MCDFRVSRENCPFLCQAAHRIRASGGTFAAAMPRMGLLHAALPHISPSCPQRPARPIAGTSKVMEMKMKKILLASVMAGGALFAVTTASLAQSAVYGPQHPYPTNAAEVNGYGQSNGQFGSSDQGYAGTITTTRRVAPRREVAPQVITGAEIGEPAPGQVR
jgi:hypothetical protein